jgi:phosphonate transport system substrate-binding protein
MREVDSTATDPFLLDADEPNVSVRMTWKAILYCSLAAAVGIVALVAIRASREKSTQMSGQLRLLTGFAPAHKGLAAKYADVDGNLLADTPGNTKDFVDPETVVLAYYKGDDEGGRRIEWEHYKQHLAQALGKNVALREYLHTGEEIAAVAAGEIHLVALHAADAPLLVNNAGFVPFAVLASEQGASGNHMVVAVSRESRIKSLADLRGKQLTCTRPDSVTGYRAAITVLLQSAQLQPNTDYQIHFSHGQKRSIRGLAEGRFEVAALSSDTLQSMLNAGAVEESDYRCIFESPIIPRLTVGGIHRLDPVLREKVIEATLNYRDVPENKSVKTQKRFVTINYKTDFEFVREMHACFDARFRQTTAKP